MRLRHWLAFALVAAVWGSGYMWNKIALRELTPLELLQWRLTLGALTLGVCVAALRPALPRRGAEWLAVGALGVLNIALPYYLIAWGQLHVDSTVAAILIASTPLQTLVVARLLLRGERLTPLRVTGAALGFAGVVVLLGRNLGGGASAGLLGSLSVLGAALGFALSSVLVRRYASRVSPLVQALGAIAVAWALIAGASAATGTAPRLALQPLTYTALGVVGVLANGLVYLTFLFLIQAVGPARTQMVSYCFPLVAVTLGVVFLDEPLFWQLLAGGALILGGIALFNRSRVPGAAAVPDRAGEPSRPRASA